MKKIISIALIISLLMLNSGFCVSAAVENTSNSGHEFLLQAEQDRTLTIHIDEPGLYQIELEYYLEKGYIEDTVIGISFDAAFNEKEDATYPLSHIYTYEYGDDRFLRDEQDNERIPNQKEVDVWHSIKLYPTAGKGYQLLAGDHTITLSCVSGMVSLRNIRLEKYVSKSYQEYLNSNPTCHTDEFYYRQEAELLFHKSDRNISVTYDRSTPNISPNSATAIRYNLLAGSSFAQDGQWVSWQFEVPQDGWYHFDVCYRQSIVSGMSVHRTVKIDGEVPFDELFDVVFPASDDMTIQRLGNGDTDYSFYLEKGPHELTFQVDLAPLQDSIDICRTIVADLNFLSNQITVVTGENIDLIRDYDLEASIPNLVETLKNNSEQLGLVVKMLGGDNGGEYAARVKEVIRVLNKMADKPRDIPQNLNYFRSQITTLSDVLAGLESQPLELDYLAISSNGSNIDAAKPYGFWSVLVFKFKSFLHSFISDYYVISSEEKALDVWVSTGDAVTNGYAVGREHAQVVDELIRDSYTSKTGQAVNVSLVSASETLLQAVASGKGPDIVLFTPETLVANLYHRDALVPLNEMASFNEVRSRFYPSSLIPLEMDDKLYALPEVQAYQMLFYRTDLFEKYNLDVPNTWNDFYHVVKQLQVQAMQVGITESVLSFETFLLQRNSGLYNENATKTLLTSRAAVESFTDWTNLYAKYGLPVSFEMLNRFRAGQMPMTVAPINFYCQLKQAAPEIGGQWAMAPIPGTVSDDGTINRAQSSLVCATVILRKNGKQDYPDEMRFLDWWTSADVQGRFAQTIEVRLGIAARYCPANVQAFDSVFWNFAERNVLLEQWKSVGDIQQTPATYLVSRNLTNAFRKVLYDRENARDVIYRYGQEIDAELTRKRQELGMDVDYED